ncbi:helix-turn-helix domain-containing protein [Nitrospinae bacterium AH-259-F20]|nr:helix-turn-helix domain-containing protein [Nitrospinae bacterium AH-259-F20]
MNRDTQKALVKVKLQEGKSWKQVSKEVGVAESTIWRWMKEDESEHNETETIKQALNLIDYDAIQKLSYISDLIANKIIEKANDNGLDSLDIKELSRAGVEVAKMFGIRMDKVMLRDGTLVPGHTAASPATMVALLLAKATADREARSRLEAEREAYEALKDEGKGLDIIDV